jgi:hypothetical protein
MLCTAASASVRVTVPGFIFALTDEVCGGTQANADAAQEGISRRLSYAEAAHQEVVAELGRVLGHVRTCAGLEKVRALLAADGIVIGSTYRSAMERRAANLTTRDEQALPSQLHRQPPHQRRQHRQLLL